MKKVLVTGGVRGIGLAIAEAFLEKGYAVYATYSKDEAAATAAKQKGIQTYKTDVSKEKEVTALFESLNKQGGIDVLINNAGVALVKQIQDVTYEEYAQVFNVNVGGAVLCSREAAKRMISKQSGVIINISSVWGEVGASCESVYAASKAALIGLTKSLAKELGYSGIRVNAVSPGVIATQMNAHLSKEDMKALQEEIPVGRIGTGEDVAKAVLFLEENEYVTGVDMPVNGGFSIV